MKKCIAMLIAIIMITASLPSVSASELLFIDESDEQYFNVLTNLGVLSLYQDEEGFFDGGKSVLRVEAAVAIADLLNLDTGKDSSIGTTFIDVLPSEPASGSIAAMVNLKAMNGFGDNLFRPYEEIQTVHFIKALIVALGYGWSADYSGGFPTGYVKVANEVNLLDGISINNDQVLTRSMMFKILYNALRVRVYDVVGVSGDSIIYDTSKDITVLTEYHNIYEETAVVNSNSMTSLNSSFEANEDSVLIGTDRVNLQDDKSIWGYLGQEVTYFYHQDHRSNTRKLISFALENNKIVTLTESSINEVSGNAVEYLSDEDGKIRKLYYNVETDIVYNGGRDAVNLKEKLENLSGTARFIDNDADGRMDVIIIDDYRYDAIHSMDLTDETIYCGGENINLEEADAWIIENDAGGILTFKDLAVGDVIAIAKSASGNKVRLVRLSSIITGKAVEMGKGTITVGETSYKVSTGADAESLAKVKLGFEYSFHLSQTGEIVYVTDTSADSLKTGYLIESAQEVGPFDSKIFLKIKTTGDVNIYEVKEKVQINDTIVAPENVVSTLKSLKLNLNLISDGEISQVVRYRLDANNMISAIYTARLEENDYLVLKFNSEGSEVLLREGYGMGTFNSKYLIGNETTFFQVPKTEQETLSDDYYQTFKLANRLESGQYYPVETYTVGDAVFPIAAVYYKASTLGISKTASLFLVDSVSQVVNEAGDIVSRFKGFINGEAKTYDSIDILDIDGIRRGDTLVFDLTPINQVRRWAKVYDAELGTVNPEYLSNEMEGVRSIMMYSVYRREGPYMEATSKDFTDMDIALDNMYALNFSRTPKIALYDSERDQIRVVDSSVIVDYAHDPVNYTKILIRYQHGFMFDTIIYK